MEYLQVHIRTHIHIVRVRVRVLCLEGLHCATSQSVFHVIPLLSSIVSKSMFSHVRSIAFLLCGCFACAIEKPFQSPWAPTAFIVLPFSLPEETDPQTCF